MENVEIAGALREVGDLLEILGANPFRVRAYRNAIRTVVEHTTPMKKLVEDGADLTELPSIGKGMADNIIEHLGPYRERRAELEANPDRVREILEAGAERARKTAAETMEKVRKKVGLWR